MSTRVNLREFQQGLAERMTEAGRGERPQSLLAVESADECWLFELSDISEVVPLPPITTVPLTRPWYAGLVNVRGALYSVVDLSAFHGGPQTLRDENARLLLAGAKHGINSALLVSRVLGLKSIDSLQQHESTDGRRPWAGDRFKDARDKRWTRMMLPRLVKAREFLEIGL